MISGVAKSKVKTALGPTEQQQKEMKTAKVANSGDKKREGSGSSREKSSAKTSSSTIGDESTQVSKIKIIEKKNLMDFCSYSLVIDT